MKRWLTPLMIGAVCMATVQLGQGSYLLLKATLAQVLLERAWHDVQTLDGRGVQAQVKPWPWADTSPLVKLRLDSLDKDFIVLSGASGRNLAFGPSHVSGSATIGDAGVSVIGGHRDTHFTALQYLNVEDPLSVELRSGERVNYVITQIVVVDSQQSHIALEADRSVLALVSCYPFDAVDAGGPLRFVVMAEAIQEAAVKEVVL